MPPVTQGSRAALVTWTVITSILFVTATILAIYFYVDASGAQDQLRTMQKKYASVAAEGELTSPEVSALLEARNDPNSGLNSSMSGIKVALTQRDNLAKLIAGAAAADDTTGNAAAKATTAANNAIGIAQKTLGMDNRALPGDNLTAAVSTLTKTLAARQQEVTNLNRNLQEAQKTAEKAQADAKAQIDKVTEMMASVRAEQESTLKSVQDITQTKDKEFSAAAEDALKQVEGSKQQVQQIQTQNAELAATNKKLELVLDKTRQKLNEIRIDPTKAVTRQPDGRIVRIPTRDTVFIDLGSGDQITPGLTFEVFDKADGIPAPGDPSNDENLPVGKASIEVVRVGNTTSECRVTRTSRGATLSEGDLIANLVYDKNTKNNFLVYGNFDLDRNGVATPQDAEVIKRLITQWGSSVVSELNVDTDFVVLGKEPVIPNVSRQELENDPLLKAKYDAAVADAEAYSDISAKARAYRIPILNQNRFLYLVGYYDRAKR
jgi:hypothetical protein